MFEVIVVGKGLIGSAAARYLGRTGRSVALIGPDEPQDWSEHQGVFASHYDQGRITRILDPDPVWADLARRSRLRYRSIEQAGGCSFYVVTGGLRVGPAGDEPENHLVQTAAVGRQLEVPFKRLKGPGLAAECPQFRFPAGMAGLLEQGGAGYLNPRALIRAQLVLAGHQGMTIIRQTVRSVEPDRTGVTLTTDREEHYRAGKVLIAAGAYTNQLLPQKLALTPKARTILLAELDPAEVARLAGLPTLIYREPGHPALSSIYLLPPIRYPDGKVYLKIGGHLLEAAVLDSSDQLRRWFQSAGSPVEREALRQVLLSLLPGLQAKSFHTRPCVTTYTPTGRPFIDQLIPGRLFVAAGGCGAAAKSSDEIGRLAAGLVEQEIWSETALPASLFETKRLG